MTNWSVRFALENNFAYNLAYPLRPIGSFLLRAREEVLVQDAETYQRVTVRFGGQGVMPRTEGRVKGSDIGTKRQFRLRAGQFVLSRIDARHGAMGIAPPDLNGAILTNDFPTYALDPALIDPRFFELITGTAAFIRYCRNCSTGTTNRQRLDEDLFLEVAVPLPPLAEQARLVADYDQQAQSAEQKRAEVEAVKEQQQQMLYDVLGIEKQSSAAKHYGIVFIDSQNLFAWGVEKNGVLAVTSSSKWPVVSFDTHPMLYQAVYRGKSPIYSAEDSTARILNQKCVRWNELETKYAKTVARRWLDGLDEDLKTRVGDILINSTGEGTIGRAAAVTEDATGLAFDSHVLLIRPEPTRIHSFLLAEMINSPYGQRQIKDLKSGQTTNQTELGAANVKKIVFPLPDFATQQLLVDNLLALKQSAEELRIQATDLEAAARRTFEAAIFA